MTVPVSDLVVAAVSKMVDDSQERHNREPSHSDLEFYIHRAGLREADPKTHGQTVGKAKRVRAVLSWAIENDPEAGGRLIEALVQQLRASGGFRETSDNYIGNEGIERAIEAFEAQGFVLSRDGELRPKNLNALTSRELSAALLAYARRARHGTEDAALLSGTGKDLLEATAAHVLTSKYGSYPQQSNFQALLGQAFVALGLATPEEESTGAEAPQCSMEKGLYEAAVGINRLRNKEGTGHGRPWVPNVTEAEARAAIELSGVIAGYMLDKMGEDCHSF